MKQKIVFLCLVVMMLFSLVWGQAWGATEYRYELSADKTDSLKVGNVVTLTLTLKQSGSTSPYKIYGAQTSVILNTTYFDLVEGSESIPSGWNYGVSNSGGEDILTFLFLDTTGEGVNTPTSLDIASFQVELKAPGNSVSLSSRNPILTDKDARKLTGVSANTLSLSIDSEEGEEGGSGPGGGDNGPNILDIYVDGSLTKSYSLKKLQARTQETVIYSMINTYPTKGFSVAKGFNLKTLLDQDFNLKGEETITFIAADGFEQTFTYKELFKDKRYYYPKLMDDSISSYMQVHTILALEYAEGKDASKLKGNEMRLCMGQRALTEQNNVWFVKDVKTIEIDTDKPDQWDEPEVDEEPGNVAKGTKVSFEYDDLNSVKIYYTTDGSTPTYNSKMYNVSRTSFQPKLNLPVIINENTTIKAIVIGAGKENSEVATFSYTIDGTVPGTTEETSVKKKVISSVELEVEAKRENNKVVAQVGLEELKDLINRGKEKWQDEEEKDKLKQMSITMKGINNWDDIIKTSFILPKSGMGELAKSTADVLSLDMKFLQAILSKKVFEAAEKEATGNLTLEVVKLEGNDIPPALQKIDNRGEIYKINIYLGDTLLTDMGGNMEVLLPYKIPEGGNAHSVVIYSSIGQNAYIYRSSQYYSDDKLASCVTTLPGIYTVGYHSANFRDINGHWATNFISQLAARDVVQGYGQNSYKPNGLVTRAEFITMLAKSIDNISLVGYSARFNDVPEDSWYYDVIGWAVANKIVSGMGDNRFAPNAPITREQMVTMIENFGRYKGITWEETKEKIAFKDMASINSWAIKSVELMTKAGIISGRPDNSFDPQGNSTRGEAAKLIYLTMQEALQ